VSILDTIWSILNSPLIVTTITSMVVYLLGKLYTKKPLWKQYEGTIIAAVRFAEKQIDDKTENKSTARLDAALKYVLEIIERDQNKISTTKQRMEIKEAIQIVHNDIEA